MMKSKIKYRLQTITEWGQTGRGLASFLVFVIIFGGIVGGAYWYFVKQKSELSETTITHERQNQQVQLENKDPVSLPGSTLGLTWNNGSFILASQVEPWGFLQVTPAADGPAQIISFPVTEIRTQKNVSLYGVTWNGKNYVGITDGTFFKSKSKKVFTIHSANNFSIESVKPAPVDAGCIVWTGAQYWVGSRLKSEDEDQPSMLYELNPNLEVVSQSNAPASGCQGMTWDRRYLWWADGYADSVYLLDIFGRMPEIVYTYKTSIQGLSGIAYDGKGIWFAGMKQPGLYYLDPALYDQWSKGSFGQDVVQDSDEAGYGDDLTTNEQAQSVQNGEAIPSGKEVVYENNEPVADNAIKFTRFMARIEEGMLVGSWTLLAGDTVVTGINASSPDGDPVFFRYRVQIDSEAMAQPVKLDFEGVGSETVKIDEVLLEGLPSGRYTISIAIHAQYYSEGKVEEVKSSMRLLSIQY